MAAESRRLVYGGRFALVYAALGAAIAAAAIGLVVALSHSSGTRPSTSWSAWHPTGGGLGLAEQIATHVGHEYTLPGGGQLVDVIAKEPTVTASNQKIAVGYVAVRGTRTVPDTVSSIDGSNSVMYTLCGLGPSCSIATGKPSVARGRLVRREILELALYTFHYDNSINDVIAFMPPRGPNVPSVIIYLQRSDLASQLNAPLAQTLSGRTPSVTTMTAKDAVNVDQLTGRRAFSFSLTRAPDGNAVLILTHLKA